MKILIIVILSVILFLSCSIQETTNNGLQNEPVETGFCGEVITDNHGEYYKQTLQIDKTDVYEYAVRPHFFNGEFVTQIELDNDGWLLIENNRWLQMEQLDFTFAIENEKIVDFIEYVELECRAIGGEEFTRNLPDRRVIGTMIMAPEGLQVGNCYRFHISEEISNLFEDGLYAQNFMYRLNVTDLEGNVTEEGEWYNTINLPDIRIIDLSENSNPPLDNFSQSNLYQIEAYVVTRNGFADIDNPASISFNCTGESNHPETIIYNGEDVTEDGLQEYLFNLCWVHNEYHYAFDKYYVAEINDIDIPYEMVDGIRQYAAPFNINLEGNYEFIGSDNTDVYFQWGFWGEYGFAQHSSHTITNSPYHDYLNHVINPDSDTDYSATIAWYEIQLDGEVPVTSYYGAEAEEVTPGWLRIRSLHPKSNKLEMDNLEYGEHILKVRACDNFGNIDPTPAEFQFEVLEYIEPEDRSGLLVLDFDPDHSFCPDAIVDSIYIQALEGFDENIDVIDIREVSMGYNNVMTMNYLLNFESYLLARSELLQYEYILVHRDCQEGYDLRKFKENLYDIQMQGSKLIMSSGTSINDLYEYALSTDDTKLKIVFNDYWGIDMNSEDPSVTLFSQSLLSYSYLIGANPLDPITTTLNLEIENSFSSLVNLIESMGLCSFFNASTLTSNIVYTYICREPNGGTHDPTQELYDYINSKPIAIHHQHNGSESWIFSFCLSFMQIEDLQMMFDEILD